jgi:DNA-directed RNA polymerase subunit M/transcription elongation factor TFIIS
MSLIEQIDKWIQERGSASVLRDHLAYLRDQIEGIQSTHRRELADLRAAHAKEIAELKTTLVQSKTVAPRQGYDVCPHCGQTMGQMAFVRPLRQRGQRQTALYHCDGCGREYEKP